MLISVKKIKGDVGIKGPGKETSLFILVTQGLCEEETLRQGLRVRYGKIWKKPTIRE